AELLRQMRLDGVARQHRVELDRSARQETRAEASEHNLGVGDRGLVAAKSIRRRAGPGACPLRADVQQARLVDPPDGAAAGTHRVDLYRRCREMVVVNDQEVGHW